LEYWRGKDYAAKVRGLYGGAPKDWKEAPKEILSLLLPEDHLTCLAEDEQGAIWIGTWQNGMVVADQKSGKNSYGNPKAMNYPDNFVTKILCLNGGDYLIGFYGGGIAKSIKPFKLVDRKPLKTRFNKNKIFSVAYKDFPNLPSKIKPPTIDELKLMQTKLERLKTPLPKVSAEYYGEDWKTQGDWMGRAFRHWAVMCGAVAPLNHPIYFSDLTYTVNDFIGPNRRQNDVARRWVHWLKTDNPRTLWNPFNGYRRQSEWDDHGEAYPLSKDGPDLWYLLEIKHKGVFRVGMYFFNKDGHGGNNRLRDYMIEFYPTSHKWAKFDDWKKLSIDAETKVSQIKPLEKSRVKDFWGGVHKQFVVTGPNNYFVKIDRNYSFNTIISAVTLDRLVGKPLNEERYGIPCLAEIPYNAPPVPESFSTAEGRQLALVWNALDNVYAKQNGVERERKARIAVYQAAAALSGTSDEILQMSDSLKWQLNQWDERQRKEYQETMKRGFEELLEVTPSLRQSIEDQKKGVPEVFKNCPR
jgi:hypothetical protein